MRRIRGTNTSPERRIRKVLWSLGLRYRVHARIGRSRPDILFIRPKVAIFVDGCFWHGCPEHYVRPRSREAFWAQKLRSNVLRDCRQTVFLESQGWTILRFWEHEIESKPDRV